MTLFGRTLHPRVAGRRAFNEAVYRINPRSTGLGLTSSGSPFWRFLGNRYRDVSAFARGISPRKAPVFVNPATVAEYRNSSNEPDFMEWMKPWIDRKDADIDRYVRSLKQRPSEHDLREQLQHWRDYGTLFSNRLSTTA
jgi:hypothetical protein